MKVSVIGAGVVGEATGVGLHKHAHEVTFHDIDGDKLKRLAKQGYKVTENLDGITGCDIYMICVPTLSQEDGAIDLTHIEQAATNVGYVLKQKRSHPLVAIRSTVIPGTTERFVIPFLEESSRCSAGVDFSVAVNPEFLRQDMALSDFLNPDRIVIGELDRESGDILHELYKDFAAPILRVDLKTAEMIKYASNAFLATKISFINEIGNICKRLGIDVYRVAEGMRLDHRISSYFLNAGIGFGGNCLPKDTRALIAAARVLGCEAPLLEGIIEVNEKQPLKLVELAERKEGTLSQRKIAILGLAFKPGTDDIGEAPSLKVIEELLLRGAKVKVYDPAAMGKAAAIFGSMIEYAGSAREAVSDADMVFVLTEWDEFRDPELYRDKKVFEGRRIFSRGEINNGDCEGICW